MNYLEEKGITDIEVKASNGYNSYKYTPNGNVTNVLHTIIFLSRLS